MEVLLILPPIRGQMPRRPYFWSVNRQICSTICIQNVTMWKPSNKVSAKDPWKQMAWLRLTHRSHLAHGCTTCVRPDYEGRNAIYGHVARPCRRQSRTPGQAYHLIRPGHVNPVVRAQNGPISSAVMTTIPPSQISDDQPSADHRLIYSTATLPYKMTSRDELALWNGTCSFLQRAAMLALQALY